MNCILCNFGLRTKTSIPESSPLSNDGVIMLNLNYVVDMSTVKYTHLVPLVFDLLQRISLYYTPSWSHYTVPTINFIPSQTALRYNGRTTQRGRPQLHPHTEPPLHREPILLPPQKSEVELSMLGTTY